MRRSLITGVGAALLALVLCRPAQAARREREDRLHAHTLHDRAAGMHLRYLDGRARWHESDPADQSAALRILRGLSTDSGSPSCRRRRHLHHPRRRDRHAARARLASGWTVWPGRRTGADWPAALLTCTAPRPVQLRHSDDADRRHGCHRHHAWPLRLVQPGVVTGRLADRVRLAARWRQSDLGCRRRRLGPDAADLPDQRDRQLAGVVTRRLQDRLRQRSRGRQRALHDESRRYEHPGNHVGRRLEQHPRLLSRRCSHRVLRGA